MTQITLLQRWADPEILGPRPQPHPPGSIRVRKKPSSFCDRICTVSSSDNVKNWQMQM